MAVTYICDDCKRQAPAERNFSGAWSGPRGWLIEAWNPHRGHDDLYEPKTFCSLECAGRYFKVEDPRDLLPNPESDPEYMSDDQVVDWDRDTPEEEKERIARLPKVVGAIL